jgi:hypothetical protein
MEAFAAHAFGIVVGAMKSAAVAVVQGQRQLEDGYGGGTWGTACVGTGITHNGSTVSKRGDGGGGGGIDGSVGGSAVAIDGRPPAKRPRREREEGATEGEGVEHRDGDNSDREDGYETEEDRDRAALVHLAHLAPSALEYSAAVACVTHAAGHGTSGQEGGRGEGAGIHLRQAVGGGGEVSGDDADDAAQGDPLAWLAWVRHLSPSCEHGADGRVALPLFLLQPAGALDEVIRAASDESVRLRRAYETLLTRVFGYDGSEGEGVGVSANVKERWAAAAEDARKVARLIRESRDRFAAGMRALQQVDVES